jgi:uncharacterized protein (DUF1697 family)
MKKYIAFLRGINVGNIRIKMPDLKTAFETMGFTDVQTYLQTGNVVFQSDKNKADIKGILEHGLSKTFNYEAYVLLYDFEVLRGIIAQYPLEKDEIHHAYVIFIENDIAFEELKTLATSAGKESERIKVGNQVLYWKVKRGESLDTPFSKILAKAKYKSSTTVRNINTLEKMV